jgi:hypothetical protein
MTTLSASWQRSFEALARRANAEEAAGDRATGDGIRHYIAAGEALTRAKESCIDTGIAWLPWLTEHWCKSECVAQRRMRMYRERDWLLDPSRTTDEVHARALEIMGGHAEEGDVEAQIAALLAGLSEAQQREAVKEAEQALAKEAQERQAAEAPDVEDALWRKGLTGIGRAVRAFEALGRAELLVLLRALLEAVREAQRRG